MKNDFPCEKCGRCCELVGSAPETSFLDRGDGVCRHYCESLRLCGIYDDRPDICRVELQYRLNFSSKMSWREFVDINVSACRVISTIQLED